MKKVAILLDGPVANDSRVIRTIESLSEDNLVDLFYVNGIPEDRGRFNNKVQLYEYKIQTSWIKQNIRFHLKFDDLIQKFKAHSTSYDFIYCNDYPLLHSAIQLKKLQTAAKLIYDSHEIYMETINQFFPVKGWRAAYGKVLIKLNRKIHKAKEKKLIEHVDFFITVCDSLKNHFETEYHRKDIIVIKNCPKKEMIPEKTNRLYKELGLPESSKLLLYQGNLNPGRGLDKLILSAQQFDPNVHVAILGNGTTKTGLMELTKQLGLKNVHFIAKVPFEELLEYTSSATAGVMFIQAINKSKELALPNKVFEYMAAGIPVISNQLAEPKRIIEKWDCGICIDDSSPERIAQSINNFLLERNDQHELGKRGKEAIRTELNWSNQVTPLLSLIND